MRKIGIDSNQRDGILSRLYKTLKDMATINFKSNMLGNLTQEYKTTDDAKMASWELFQNIVNTMAEKTGNDFNPCEIDITSFTHDYKLYDIVSYDDGVVEWEIEIIH